jgi:hypothetical protein
MDGSGCSCQACTLSPTGLTPLGKKSKSVEIEVSSRACLALAGIAVLAALLTAPSCYNSHNRWQMAPAQHGQLGLHTSCRPTAWPGHRHAMNHTSPTWAVVSSGHTNTLCPHSYHTCELRRSSQSACSTTGNDANNMRQQLLTAAWPHTAGDGKDSGLQDQSNAGQTVPRRLSAPQWDRTPTPWPDCSKAARVPLNVKGGREGTKQRDSNSTVAGPLWPSKQVLGPCAALDVNIHAVLLSVGGEAWGHTRGVCRRALARQVRDPWQTHDPSAVPLAQAPPKRTVSETTVLKVTHTSNESNTCCLTPAHPC